MRRRCSTPGPGLKTPEPSQFPVDAEVVRFLLCKIDAGVENNRLGSKACRERQADFLLEKGTKRAENVVVPDMGMTLFW